MKRMLFLIFNLILTTLVFAGTVSLELYVPASLSETNALTYVKLIGGIDEIKSTGSVNIDAEYKLLYYDVIYTGNQTNSGKMVLYYPVGTYTDTYKGIKIDEENRYMVGSISLTKNDGNESNDAKNIKERNYITYDDIGSYVGDNNGIAAGTEYKPTSDESLIAAPIYSDPESNDFMNGNVVTHIFEVVNSKVTVVKNSKTLDKVIFPAVNINSGNETGNKTSDTWTELENWLNNNVTSDGTDNDGDGFAEDSDGNNTLKYFRDSIKIRKYVYFVPGTATAITPPASVLKGLKIKSRTNGSNRQRTSSITVGADDYIVEVRDSGDPNPFKITEMEERGKN